MLWLPNLLTKAITGITAWFAGLLGFKKESKEIAAAGKEFSFGDLIMKAVEAIGKWFGDLFEDIKNFDFKGLAKSIMPDFLSNWLFGEEKPEQKTKTKKTKEGAKKDGGILDSLADSFIESFKTFPDKLLALFNSLVQKIISIIPGFEPVTEASKYWDTMDFGSKKVDTKALQTQVSMMSAEDLVTLKGGLEKEQQDSGLDNAKEVFAIIAAREAALEKEGGVTGSARGGIVTKPAYLPASGTVVGEHPTWSGGKGAFGGGFVPAPEVPDRTGKGEAIIPLDGQRGGSILADALAPSVTGAVLNQMQMERVGMDTAVASAAPTIVDSSTNTQVFNETNIRNPSVDSPHVFGESTDKLIRIRCMG
jgi:hypothetical protein